MNESRQDIVVDAVLCVYQNRLVYIEFLLYLLTYRNVENKLEDSLFYFLASTEFIGVIREISIILVHITNPLRSLVSRTHQLVVHDWSAYHISRVCDDLEIALEDIIDNPSLFLKEDFMKSIFKR